MTLRSDTDPSFVRTTIIYNKNIEYLCTVIPMVILCLYDEDDEEPLRTLQGATKSLRSRKKTDE